MKTHTLKEYIWFEKTDKGLIYLYLTNGDRLRLSKAEARYINKKTNED